MNRKITIEIEDEDERVSYLVTDNGETVEQGNVGSERMALNISISALIGLALAE